MFLYARGTKLNMQQDSIEHHNLESSLLGGKDDRRTEILPKPPSSVESEPLSIRFERRYFDETFTTREVALDHTLA